MECCRSLKTPAFQATPSTSFFFSQKSRSLKNKTGQSGNERFKIDIEVPQGAVLSHLLFLIFVSETFSAKEVETFKFAYDGSLLLRVDTEVKLNGPTRTTSLKVFRSCTEWRLRMNIEKTIPIQFNRRRHIFAQKW